MDNSTENKVGIAVLVSGGGTNLRALINAERGGIIHSGSIRLVISSRSDAYALTRAREAGIPTAVVSKKECGGQAEAERRITELLEEYGIGLIVLAGYMSILTPAFTARYDRRIINVHPSLIPSFCGEGFYGLRVHEAALPDGGEIIAQRAVEVHDGDTPEQLQRRVMEQAEWIILPQAAEAVCRKIRENDR